MTGHVTTRGKFLEPLLEQHVSPRDSYLSVNQSMIGQANEEYV